MLIHPVFACGAVTWVTSDGVLSPPVQYFVQPCGLPAGDLHRLRRLFLFHAPVDLAAFEDVDRRYAADQRRAGRSRTAIAMGDSLRSPPLTSPRASCASQGSCLDVGPAVDRVFYP